MRIIIGKYKGKPIKMPVGIRPTQNKVRKALFDILGDIEGLDFLELFAGSASVGLEAVSKGVRELVLVEANRNCQLTIEKNIEALKPDSWRLYPYEAEKAIRMMHKEQRQFDLIFLDPPYYQELSKKTLQILGACDILAPNGLVIVQHFKRESLPESAGRLVKIKKSVYGDTVLSFYRKS